MFVTSAVEVAVPGIPDLLLVIDDYCRTRLKVLGAELIVACELDGRLDPDLRFAIGGLDMDMQPLLLTREEKEPVANARGCRAKALYNLRFSLRIALQPKKTLRFGGLS